MWFQKPTDGRDAAAPQGESFADMVEGMAPAAKKAKVKKAPKEAGIPFKDRMAALMARLRGGLANLDMRALALKGGSATFGLVLMGGILGWIFIGAREGIVLHAPSLYNTYQRLGLSVTPPGAGLVFEQPAAEWAFDTRGEPVLALKGAVLNTAETARHVPPLRATLIMKSGAKGDSRIIPAAPTILAPKGKAPFLLQLPEWQDHIGAGTADVLLSFAVEELDTAGSIAGHAEGVLNDKVSEGNIAIAPDAVHDTGAEPSPAAPQATSHDVPPPHGASPETHEVPQSHENPVPPAHEVPPQH